MFSRPVHCTRGEQQPTSEFLLFTSCWTTSFFEVDYTCIISKALRPTCHNDKIGLKVIVFLRSGSHDYWCFSYFTLHKLCFTLHDHGFIPSLPQYCPDISPALPRHCLGIAQTLPPHYPSFKENSQEISHELSHESSRDISQEGSQELPQENSHEKSH